MVGIVDSSGAYAVPDDFGVDLMPQSLRNHINDSIEEHSNNLNNLARGFEQHFPYVSDHNADEMQHFLYSSVDLACDHIQALIDNEPTNRMIPADIDQVKSHAIEIMKPLATLDMTGAKKAKTYRGQEMGQHVQSKHGVSHPKPKKHHHHTSKPKSSDSNESFQDMIETMENDGIDISMPQFDQNAFASAQNTAYQELAIPELSEELAGLKPGGIHWAFEVGAIYQRVSNVFGEQHKPDQPVTGTTATPKKPKID